MTINQLTLFLRQNIRQVKNEIMPELDADFTTQDFIKKFANKFEGVYINYLYYYKGNGAFRSVHSQIANFLSDNAQLFNIRKTRKVKTEDELGEGAETQVWEKRITVYKECYY